MSISHDEACGTDVRAGCPASLYTCASHIQLGSDFLDVNQYIIFVSKNGT